MLFVIYSHKPICKIYSRHYKYLRKGKEIEFFSVRIIETDILYEEFCIKFINN